jgi:adenosine deaminase
MTDLDYLRRMPKTELHLHLEGTTSPETLWSLAARHHIALPVSTLDELRALYTFQDFGKFVELWLLMCRCFRAEADYEALVDGFTAECARQRIRYAELHFTPYNHELFGFGGERALAAVTRRLLDATAAGGPVTRLILDIPSESIAESGPYTAALLERLSNPLVVAIGLGGPEDGFPRLDAAPYFARARAAGYACVAHAGETAGAAHVRDAVEVLGAQRIQHGVRAAEDPAVVALLAQRRICCDVALTSNLFLTRYRTLAEHPLRTLLDAGVPLTLSTDDPPFFNTDLTRELTLAHTELSLSREAVWQLNLNGLRYGLAEPAVRRALMLEFERFALENV